MGIANSYNRVIRRQLKQHAAWLPITNVFALGDFGVVSNGLFTRIGNISDLGVQWKEKPGSPSELNYSSNSVTTTRVEAGGKVNAFSDSTSIDAKLTFTFKRESTFVLRAANVTSKEIDNIFAVATALHNHNGWRRRYRFVTRVYSAQNPLLLASREGSTDVTLTGKASALKQVDLGNIAAEIGVSATRELALEITGKSGVIGLGLGRVTFGGGVRALATDGAEGQVGVDEDSDWDDDPRDDI